MTKRILLLLGAIGILGGIHLATLRGGHEWGDDFSLYIAHARNISEGRAYADTGYIYNPRNPILSPRTYPPVFPLLLAPVYHFRGVDLEAMKVFVVLLFMALLGTLALIYRQRLPLPYTLGCLALFALNPYVWQIKDRLLSETPFMLFVYLALLLAEQARSAEMAKGYRLGCCLLAGLFAYLAFGTRTAGVVLVPSVLAVELVQRRRLGWPSLTIAAVAVAGVALQKMLVVLDGSYLDQCHLNLAQLASTAAAVARGMGLLVTNGHGGIAGIALYACLLIPAGVGYLARLRQGATVYEAFAAAYCCLMVLWPPFDTAALRYLMPVLPLFFLYVVEGLILLGATSWSRVAAPAASVLAVAVLASYAAWYARLEVGPVSDGVSNPETVELFHWIDTQTRSEDVFLFQKPRALALFTRRHAVGHHRADDEAQIRHLFRSAGVTHVVLAQSSPSPALQMSRKLVEPIIAGHDADFEKVYESAGYRVYRLREEALARR